MENNKYQQLTTSDMYLSAFLFNQKEVLVGAEILDNITTFCYEGSEDIDDLKDMYYAGAARVNPIEYKNAIKEMKSIVYKGYEAWSA